jgi:hypothetical protein
MITSTPSSIRMLLEDLGGIDAGRYSGGNRRYQCPIHGGNGRSLSIIDTGERAGTGHCHNASCEGNNKTVVILDYPGRDPHYRPSRPRSPDDVAREWMTIPAKQPTQKNLAAWQQKEIDTLRRLWDASRPRARMHDERALAYLAARGLEASIMDFADIGYIPDTPGIAETWCDRLMFPLWSPDGTGFIGRALWGWRAGMDEQAHKTILDCSADKSHVRWYKTAIAGWYGVPASELAPAVFIVEGALDRLALLAAGCDPEEVIALAGTALNVEWLPRQVERVIIALDSDDAGQARAASLARDMRAYGITSTIALAPHDELGKDASERYRRGDVGALAYIFDAYEPTAQSD